MKNIKLSVFISLFFVFVFLSGTANAQQTEYVLSKAEKKIMKQKKLEKYEMVYLLKHGYTLKKIENTPTPELKKEIKVEKVTLTNAYNECMQKNKMLEEEIKKLRKENAELKSKINKDKKYK